MSNHIISTRGGAMAAEGHKTRRAALRTFVGASGFAIRTICSIGSALGVPIFPVIERHLVTWRAVEALVPTIDAVAAERQGREVTQADRDAFERARTLEDRTLEDLLATPPTTFAGMRAAIEYLSGFEDGYLSESARPFLTTLLKSPLFANLESKCLRPTSVRSCGRRT